MLLISRDSGDDVDDVDNDVGVLAIRSSYVIVHRTSLLLLVVHHTSLLLFVVHDRSLLLLVIHDRSFLSHSSLSRVDGIGIGISFGIGYEVDEVDA